MGEVLILSLCCRMSYISRIPSRLAFLNITINAWISNIFDVFQSFALFFLQQTVRSLASGISFCLSDMTPVVFADPLVFGMTCPFKPILCVSYPWLRISCFSRGAPVLFHGYLETTFWVLKALTAARLVFVSRPF